MSTGKTSKELHLAELIVSVLPEGSVVRICSDDRETFQFAVRGSNMKLRQIVLSRASLVRLLGDPTAAIKIEYLQRDLSRSASKRSEYRYPREIRRVSRKGRSAARAAAVRSLSALASVL